MTLMKYNGETEELVVFSSLDGEELLRLDKVSFYDYRKIAEAVRSVEKKAQHKIAVCAAGELSKLIKTWLPTANFDP